MRARGESSGAARGSGGSRSTRGWTQLPVWALPLLVLFVGAAASTMASTVAGTRQTESRRAEFERQAAQVAVAARMGFDVPLEVLRSVPAFFEASDEVTREDFRAFVSDSLRRYPWIYALEWIPEVPAGERAAYEAAARADGLDGYHFKEDAPTGPPVPAASRSVYYPLFYMEPPNETALGIEETALEARRVALERARDEDRTIISERLRLVQDAPGVVSVIAFHPVYERSATPDDVDERRATLEGFAAAVFRVDPVITEALRDYELDDLDVTIADVDAPEPQLLLYESRSGALEAQLAGESASFEHVAEIGGRRWLFRVSDRAGWVHAGEARWLWLGIGLLASLLAAGVLLGLGVVHRLRTQVTLARELGQYTLVEKLGEGGMGTVYRAHHALLRRPTAIKLLHPNRSTEQALARFEREVQAASALTHPNSLVVYDYGHTDDGTFYYAMEYIDGVTLQELVDADGAQPPGRVVSILKQVCGALSEAHGVGLVHRDVKPANIMLCNRGGLYDQAKVLDYGLVTAPSDEESGLSHPSTLIGTPLYMAPEMITGSADIDARADIYALGAVAYFLLTGSPVFDGATVVELCAKHLSLPPEPVGHRVGPGRVPAELEAVILQCLAKSPEDRFPSADALAAALERSGVTPWSVADARRWWGAHGDELAERVASQRRPRPEVDAPTAELVPRPRERTDRDALEPA